MIKPRWENRMKKVLILDDEPKVRDLYHRILDSAGLDVLEAEDTLEATGILACNRIDVVLLDLNLRGLTGELAYRVIRDLNPRAQIVVFSSESLDEQRRLIPKANDYFDKSQGSFILLEKIYNILF